MRAAGTILIILGALVGASCCHRCGRAVYQRDWLRRGTRNFTAHVQRRRAEKERRRERKAAAPAAGMSLSSSPALSSSSSIALGERPAGQMRAATGATLVSDNSATRYTRL